MAEELRWKQRFENFEKAYSLLKEALAREILTDLEKEGLIQRFEYTFELAWKTVRDYLKKEGIDVNLPREVIKHAFQNEIIMDGTVWLDMLEKRNLMAHTYDESRFSKALKKINEEYFEAISQVFLFLKKHQECPSLDYRTKN